VIRPLEPADVPAYTALRLQSLVLEPHSFASSPEDDKACDPDFVRAALKDPDQVIFGFFNPELAGAVGVYRDKHLKARHKTHIWGMYVTQGNRGAGIGRRLLEAAVDWSRTREGVIQVHLVVSPRTPKARALYQSLGFRLWGVEPNALRINGELIDDEHMVLRLIR
jgi:RimJ/RimL family protein N-acetyltransferase